MRSTYRLMNRSQFILKNQSFARLMVVFLFAIRLNLPNAIQAEERYRETLVPSVIPSEFAQNGANTSKLPNESVPSDTPVPPAPQSAATDLPAMVCSPPAPLNLPQACRATWDNSNDGGVYVSAFGGSGYFSVPVTNFGGLYGASAAKNVSGRVFAYGLGGANTYSHGTQAFGTVGAFVAPDYYGDIWDRFGGGVFYDQMTDTALGSPYLSQGRYRLDYRALPLLTFGVQYMDPLISGTSQPFFPGGMGTTIRTFQVVQGQVTFGGTTLSVGYVDRENSMTYSIMHSRYLSRRISAVLSGTYDDRVRLWSGFAYLQFDLTRPSTNFLTAQSQTTGRQDDVVRGESSVLSSYIFFVDDPGFNGNSSIDEYINFTNRQGIQTDFGVITRQH